MLSGYKTYITAILAVLGALGGWLSGTLELGAAIQLAVTALLSAFVRNGIK